MYVDVYDRPLNYHRANLLYLTYSILKGWKPESRHARPLLFPLEPELHSALLRIRHFGPQTGTTDLFFFFFLLGSHVSLSFYYVISSNSRIISITSQSPIREPLVMYFLRTESAKKNKGQFKSLIQAWQFSNQHWQVKGFLVRPGWQGGLRLIARKRETIPQPAKPVDKRKLQPPSS
ncbi:hypothetical protein BGZ63DRAFT_394759 [Mariannaea sp. PMI_226]|nr:hypothetical protein BGZ63DRAFT_394759 [Mariannaea sp. PMI_226]